ncbi:MAG: DNA polymerase beta domain-containing protein [Candidatus Berkelbacteria bacterium Licking1014_7]|uniref:DNA polymerase beta domain-containing protein n=1 Tax=Candidatus Berkelbacteria bacterium Licking1014_7 TaxID=2017147 RepID=A0A554LLH3_9BACT|nr:MAG: DNA polymerase beta domain-containing protein [Candidatus Berkelbacteria bacterium Licking1014_7]
MKSPKVNPELKSITDQIVKGYKPEKIILFGSFTMGKPNKNSDYDLFIIKNTREKFFDRMTTVRKKIVNYPSRGVDIMVYTPQELQTPNYFIETVLSKGKTLYEKNPSLSGRN